MSTAYCFNSAPSEWRIVIRSISLPIGIDDIVARVIIEEALDLPSVVGFEQFEDLEEEVLNLDDSLIG